MSNSSEKIYSPSVPTASTSPRSETGAGVDAADAAPEAADVGVDPTMGAESHRRAQDRFTLGPRAKPGLEVCIYFLGADWFSGKSKVIRSKHGQKLAFPEWFYLRYISVFTTPRTNTYIVKKCTAYSMESIIYCNMRNDRYCTQYTFWQYNLLFSVWFLRRLVDSLELALYVLQTAGE